MDELGRTKGSVERTSPVNIAHNYNYQHADADVADDHHDVMMMVMKMTWLEQENITPGKLRGGTIVYLWFVTTSNSATD